VLNRSEEGISEGRLELELFSFGGGFCLMFGKQRPFKRRTCLYVPTFCARFNETRADRRQKHGAFS
jgi:hypothetical protein